MAWVSKGHTSKECPNEGCILPVKGRVGLMKRLAFCSWRDASRKQLRPRNGVRKKRNSRRLLPIWLNGKGPRITEDAVFVEKDSDCFGTLYEDAQNSML